MERDESKEAGDSPISDFSIQSSARSFTRFNFFGGRETHLSFLSFLKLSAAASRLGIRRN